MNKTLYYVIRNEETGEESATLGDCESLARDSFNPLMRAVFVMDFVIHGKTYAERKASLDEKARDFSNNQAGGLYGSDVYAIENYFEENGKRYGLITDFRINGIC